MAKSVVETTIELLGKLDPSVQKVMGQAQKAASKTGDAIGKALSAGFKVGVAAAGAFTTALVKIGTEYQAATGQISAATGATGAELESLQGVMENVYGNNYGDSMADVADAVATVSQQMKGLSDGELQSVTEGAFALRDVFQYDVAESVRAANALVNNFGISGDDAMNLIAAGAQNGLDFSGELLDTISEYSVQFAKVGIDADQMFQIMQAGADSGAWNLDKVGDAIKEMSIRVVDGSDTTISGFKKIGLNADLMAQKFAAGGDTAQEAFQETIAALAAMEDPIKQNDAGVKLFGTMWEDLGPEVVAQLASITDEAYAAGDELSKMSEVKYDNLGDAVQGLWRKVQTELVPMASKLTGFLKNTVSNIDLTGLGDALSSGFDMVFNKVVPIIQPIISMIQGSLVPALQTVGSVLTGTVLPTIQSLVTWMSQNQDLILAIVAGIAAGVAAYKAYTTAVTAYNAIMAIYQAVTAASATGTFTLAGAMAALNLPVLAVVAAIAAVVAIGVLLYKNWDVIVQKATQFGTMIVQVFNNIKAWVGGALASIAATLQSVGATIMSVLSGWWQNIQMFFTNVQNAFLSIINFIVGFFTSAWSAAWQNVTNIFGTIWGGIVGLVKGPINAVIGIINSAIGAINSISVTIPDWVPLVGGQTLGFNIPQIPMLATGGTIEQPMLAVVGDAPETIVPHGNTPRNRALLGEAAAGVGASIGGTVVNFNVTISGGADAASVTQGLLDAEDELERRLDAYFAKKARLSFA